MIGNISHQKRLLGTSSLSPQAQETSRGIINKSVSQSKGLKIKLSQINKNLHNWNESSYKTHRSINKEHNEAAGASTGLGFASTLQETTNSIEL